MSDKHSEVAVPDLYELAFMPGQFRCPQCGFQWSIQTLNVARGVIGTTEEDRQTPDCPNDGTLMVCVTYREQLEAYAKRLKEELDNRDRLLEALEFAKITFFDNDGGLCMECGETLGLQGDICPTCASFEKIEAAIRQAKGGR